VSRPINAENVCKIKTRLGQCLFPFPINKVGAGVKNDFIKAPKPLGSNCKWKCSFQLSILNADVKRGDIIAWLFI